MVLLKAPISQTTVRRVQEYVATSQVAELNNWSDHLRRSDQMSM